MHIARYQHQSQRRALAVQGLVLQEPELVKLLLQRLQDQEEQVSTSCCIETNLTKSVRIAVEELVKDDEKVYSVRGEKGILIENISQSLSGQLAYFVTILCYWQVWDRSNLISTEHVIAHFSFHSHR